MHYQLCSHLHCLCLACLIPLKLQRRQISLCTILSQQQAAMQHFLLYLWCGCVWFAVTDTNSVYQGHGCITALVVAVLLLCSLCSLTCCCNCWHVAITYPALCVEGVFGCSIKLRICMANTASSESSVCLGSTRRDHSKGSGW